jgi:hypothetical protein
MLNAKYKTVENLSRSVISQTPGTATRITPEQVTWMKLVRQSQIDFFHCHITDGCRL